MKGLVCLLLMLETFVFVDGGLNENEIGQQLSSEDGRQNPPQTDTLRAEASTDSQQYCHLCFPDIHAALRELNATVTEQKGHIRELKENNRELTATVKEQKGHIRELTATVTKQKEINRELTATDTEQKENVRALETRLKDEMNKTNYETSDFTLGQVEELRKENRDREIAFSAGLMESGKGHVGPYTTEITLTFRNVFTNIGNAYNPITGIFTAPLKGVYMFRVSAYGRGGTAATADIVKNRERKVIAHDYMVISDSQNGLNSSNGVVLILKVGDVVYVRLWSGRRLFDDSRFNHNTFSGFLLFPLR